MGEGDLAGGILEGLRLAGFVLHLLRLQELEHPPGGGGGRLEAGEGLGNLGEGAGEQPDVDHEGDDDAEGDVSVQGEERADDADGDVAEVPDKVHHRHHQAGEELALPAGIVELFV